MLYFTDDDIESFGEKYELEIDEQPLWIQEAYGLYNEKTYTGKTFIESKNIVNVFSIKIEGIINIKFLINNNISERNYGQEHKRW